jgi:hypothetical protein
MSANSAQGVEPGDIGVSRQVSISRWVHELYPDWDPILTAHDVARLIRRRLLGEILVTYARRRTASAQRGRVGRPG